ncbi:CDF family Co(II)/Ni(II) efflux transporter DmeF [uncultured Oxalicibacterium sp.]|uniref:CDF family Co(II)/Ni(II) efflux transporter DmeF n=1 Tax=uncultured Oxalicibacterium sp. TaxID=1168540 RepID=UPI0025D40482|nr:CDF family Co(II)/Ni(II) efflux transporter DmeF [uncultured Oxalicibacterium sp.]
METATRTHEHVFNEGNPIGERKTAWALALTVVMMVAEITGGYLFNSMALLADGWHMSSHSLALGLSVAAFVLARRLAHDTRFAFGTWKIEILGAYTSAILLLVVAGLMFYQSVDRLLHPAAVHYDQAIQIAVIGLLVNLACAWLLKDDHAHHHHHDHAHDHHHAHEHHSHHDLNLRSAYLHVVADAATSVLAIIALFGGKLWNAGWMDPVMGIVGAILVSVWAVGLLRDSGRVLLDAEMDAPIVEEVRQVIADSPVPAIINDLHVWRVGKEKYACILGLQVQGEANAEDFRHMLSIHEELAHVTIEISHASSRL